MDTLVFPSKMRIAISAALFDEMRTHVQQWAPEEACGLLAGLATNYEMHVMAVLPVENTLHSPVRFRMEPYAQLAALSWIDERGFTLAGIFHSHPAGPPHPSATDLAEAFYPEAASLIWYPQNRQWRCRAYRISAGSYQEVQYHLSADEQL